MKRPSNRVSGRGVICGTETLRVCSLQCAYRADTAALILHTIKDSASVCLSVGEVISLQDETSLNPKPVDMLSAYFGHKFFEVWRLLCWYENFI